MKMTYNVNPQEQPVNAKICDYGAEEVVSLDNVSEVRTGMRFDVKGKTFAHIRVDGEFEAEVIVLGYFSDKSGDHEIATVYKHKSCESVRVITGAGGYFVDLTKYQFICARVNKYTSGSVTATMTLFTKPTVPYVEKDRNSQIAYSHAFSVNGGGYGCPVNTISIGGFPFQYVVVRADASHDFRVAFYYGVSNMGSFGAPMGDMFVADVKNTVRTVSDWTEAKGDKLSVYIHNDDTEAHNYDVYLYGVR